MMLFENKLMYLIYIKLLQSISCVNLLIHNNLTLQYTTKTIF